LSSDEGAAVDLADFADRENVVFVFSTMADRSDLKKNAATKSPDDAHDASNPKVFFDIKIGGVDSGRIAFEVIAKSE
jgi:hypothetical protein